MKYAGDVVFPDVDFPLPIKLFALAALAWIFFGPVVIGAAARRGEHVGRAIGAYAVGAIVATVYHTWLSGMMGESFAPRVGVWARHIWAPFLCVALVLSLAAVGVGRLVRRFRPARP